MLEIKDEYKYRIRVLLDQRIEGGEWETAIEHGQDFDGLEPGTVGFWNHPMSEGKMDMTPDFFGNGRVHGIVIMEKEAK